MLEPKPSVEPDPGRAVSEVRDPVSPLATTYQQELDQVADLLLESLTNLYAPLGDLARAQLRDSQPYVRAAFSLAAAYGDGTQQAFDDDLCKRRIFLAAALEMLSVALGIHALLVTIPADQSPDRSIVGSTILAGDYCFSRAAHLAAQTESPEVVAIFSSTLKSISEGQLRTLVLSDDAHATEESFLLQAAVDAAAQLARLAPPAIAFAQRVATWLVGEGAAPEPSRAGELSTRQVERWDKAIAWLTAHRA